VISLCQAIHTSCSSLRDHKNLLVAARPFTRFLTGVAGLSVVLHRTMLLWDLTSHTKLSVMPLFASLSGHDTFALKWTEAIHDPQCCYGTKTVEISPR
jgi:hypothetical protein